MPRPFATVVTVVLLTVVASVLPAAAQPSGDAIIIDELDGGFVPRGSGWRDGAGGHGDHHYWQQAATGRAGRGTWRATLPAPGRYRIQAAIPRRHGTTTAARYLIDTPDGVVRRTADQSRRRGAWLDLGTHRLGTNAVVRLSARTADARRSGRTVAFDALRFIPRRTLAAPVIRDIVVEPRDDRAIVTFSLDAKGPARTEYRQQGDDEWLVGADETSDDYADHRQAITGLMPLTDYELRVVATDAGGTTTSDSVPFTTTDVPPPVTP